LVAEVQADIGDGEFSAWVDPQLTPIYRDSPNLVIKGEGFNPAGTTLQFTNGLLGKGKNYTISSITENQLVLSLTYGSHWRRNPKNLPSPLTLLSVNVGKGWIPVGPPNAKKGRSVATVYQRPVVIPSSSEVFETHTHQIIIRGEGFTK